MDSAVLLDFCFVLTSALCVLLLLYGAWLCLPMVQRKSPEETKDETKDETESEAMAGQPRPRIRAGSGGR